jgi:hypothetical protein
MEGLDKSLGIPWAEEGKLEAPNGTRSQAQALQDIASAYDNV